MNLSKSPTTSVPRESVFITNNLCTQEVAVFVTNNSCAWRATVYLQDPSSVDAGVPEMERPSSAAIDTHLDMKRLLSPDETLVELKETSFTELEEKVESEVSNQKQRFEWLTHRIIELKLLLREMHVGDGKLVIVQCHQDMPTQKPGCSYYSTDLLCGCSIYIANDISNSAMTARLTNSLQPRTEFIVEYPVNLVILASVFDMNKVAGVGGDDFFPEEYAPNYQLLKWLLYLHRW